MGYGRRPRDWKHGSQQCRTGGGRQVSRWSSRWQTQAAVHTLKLYALIVLVAIPWFAGAQDTVTAPSVPDLSASDSSAAVTYGIGSSLPFPAPEGSAGSEGWLGYLDDLSLTEEQKDALLVLVEELRAKHWALMGEGLALSVKARKLFAVEPLDPEAIGKVYADLYDVKIRMLQASVTAWNKVNEVLTEEQRSALRELTPLPRKQ